MFGLVTQQRRRIRNRLGLHVSEHAAVGALETNLVTKLALNPLISVNYDCHIAQYFLSIIYYRFSRIFIINQQLQYARSIFVRRRSLT